MRIKGWQVAALMLLGLFIMSQSRKRLTGYQVSSPASIYPTVTIGEGVYVIRDRIPITLGGVGINDRELAGLVGHTVRFTAEGNRLLSLDVI